MWWLLLPLALVAVACLTQVPAQDIAPSPANDNRSSTEATGASDSLIEIVVPSNDGVISWQDVAAAIAEALQLDQTTIQKLFPSGQIDLRSRRARLVLMGLDLALGDSVSVKMIHPPGRTPALRLRIDRSAFGSKLSQLPQSRRPATIDIDCDWQSRTRGKPLLVCLHGLHSGPDVFNGLRSTARDAGYATAAVSYDDRQAIGDTAREVADQFDRLLVDASRPVRLVLIGHSMGGLVAREWTENRSIPDGDRIVALITVGTPHGGSHWASLPLLELFVDGRFHARHVIDILLHDASTPGFRDLEPGSPFLRELAKRPLRDGVRYTTVVGTGSPIHQQDLATIQKGLRKLDRDRSLVRLIRPRIQLLLENFDELLPGKGDGAVAVVRAKIVGVDDVVLVDRSHGQLLHPPARGKTQPVWQAILNRVKELDPDG